MLSDSPPERDVQWTEAGIEGASRFQQRIWKLVQDSLELAGMARGADTPAAEVEAIRKLVHRAVKAVGDNVEALRFNSAVAQIYELTNGLGRFAAALEAAPSANGIAALREGVAALVQLVGPMMPHLAEECWRTLGHERMVAETAWPQYDAALTRADQVVMAVQVNGKRRAEITVPKGAPRELVEREVLSLDAIARMLDGKAAKKLIIVPDRIVNVVI
jgi:leucyl-tRNA synthetase